ncbi:MAG: DNA polymerase I, partial [Acidobacteria bacterium]|nr:DNA polymerase I [Acidobacteriota bacterium]
MPSPKKLLLIDSLGLVFRAYYVPMPARLTAKGVPTKVPYLFATMTRRILADHQPDYVAAVFDTSGPTFRDELFAQYKAQRPPFPEELVQQLPLVHRWCEASRIPIVELSGFEADDLIGALAKQAAKKKLEVLILTSDKDMLQLVTDRVRVLRPGIGKNPDRLVDEAAVEEILGLPPAKVADYMALLGDKIDNIPGARGIGEKGALELIKRFGSAEAALKRAEEVESKRYREALLNSRDAVVMSKKLATIAADAPFPLDLDNLKHRDPDFDALRNLYIELELNSLLKSLPASTTPDSPATHSTAQGSGPTSSSDYQILDSLPALQTFLNSLPAKKEISLWPSLAPDDSESEGFHSRIASVEISAAPGSARTVWLGVGQTATSVL